MTFKPISLNRLFFIGPALPVASLNLFPGLNIVYGGSNAGKSFTLKALDFMLGADSLKMPKQGQNYTHLYLWVTLSDGSKNTLSRSASGGDISLFEGHVEENLNGVSRETLASNQKTKTKKKKRSVSDYFFENMGMPLGAQILRNETGDKVTLSLRLLSRYLLVGEESMVTEGSPLKSLDQRLSTEDKSIFRFLLNGKDDSAIASVPKTETLKANREGKLEVLEEMVAEIEVQLRTVTRTELVDRLDSLDQSLADIQLDAKKFQSELDARRISRRNILESQSLIEDRLSSHSRMLMRFEELRSTYLLDMERLEALQEGSLLFSNLSARPCAVCGAEPNHQHHPEGVHDFEAQSAAAEAEIEKILRDLDGLKFTISALNKKIEVLTKNHVDLAENLAQEDRKIDDLLPLEGASRQRYEEAVSERLSLQNRLALFQLKEAHEGRIAALKAQKLGKQRADGLPDPIGSSSGAEFSRTVLAVLKAWNFPQIQTVDFDFKKQDIVVNGKERSDNGKGIRAILHSAMKVALLVYCHEKNLPHPGFVVLDSPLLTYRSPLKGFKHGELRSDEKELGQTALNEAFYAHLSSMSAFAQFLVFENQDPPESITGRQGVQIWSGENGTGRQGLFPVLD
ncbi:hypothetical protein [Bordetella tumulicola]|uniref:hypothetical protein n=1 Tax=Bordetella tumulicola TaxID=1649133 RepID=UPI0039F04F7D